MVEMHSLLIGESATGEGTGGHPVGTGGHRPRGPVIHLRTQYLGPEMLVGAKIALAPSTDLATVAAAIDRAEASVRAAVPIALRDLHRNPTSTAHWPGSVCAHGRTWRRVVRGGADAPNVERAAPNRWNSPSSTPTSCPPGSANNSPGGPTVFGVSVVVGAGIFTVTATTFGQHHRAGAVGVFVIAVITCALAALCYAEFAPPSRSPAAPTRSPTPPSVSSSPGSSAGTSFWNSPSAPRWSPRDGRVYLGTVFGFSGGTRSADSGNWIGAHC